ncbi:ABC transporter ATP-binding protein, partial [Amycolatopsis lurida]
MTTAPPRPRQASPARETAPAPTGGWIRRLAASCWKHPWLVVLSLGAAIIGVGLQAAGPLLIREALDDAVAGDTSRLGLLATVMAVLQVLTFGNAFA